MDNGIRSRHWIAIIVLGVLAGALAGAQLVGSDSPATKTPRVGADWPKPLPNGWKIGAVTGLAADSQGHVWVLHRAAAATNRKRDAEPAGPSAPPLVEFDTNGTFVRAWGGQSVGYEWPVQEHGLAVDEAGNVWISGRGQDGLGHILKFTKEGKYLLGIGRQGKEGDKPTNSDTTTLGTLPADMSVNPSTRELFVADGERGNRRVIVFDSETGAFLRLWGAYGEKPDEGPARAPDSDGSRSKTFSSVVHCVRVAKDGLVYVCDRGNNRIQVFQKDGKFVTEVVIEKNTPSPGTTTAIAFSPDQKRLYVGDGANKKVWVLDRASLRILNSIETGTNIQTVAIDSSGSLYVGASTGKVLEKVPAADLPRN